MTPDILTPAMDEAAAFHFLRPWWLLAIVPALLLCILAVRRIRSGGSDWRRLVDAHLLRHLALPGETRGRRWPLAVALAGWVLAAVAIAGPTWEKLPTPALDRLDPTVIVLSLTQSMNATDQSPNRLMRARHKAEDILDRMKGGQVGLIIYADAPFVAAPLTEDTRVISQMMPELATNLMPVLNDRLDLAIGRAEELLKSAGALSGRIVVLTDSLGDKPQASLDAARTAAAAGYSVNVIGIGSPAGAPMVAFDGSPVKDESGNARMTRMDPERLSQLAQAGRGTFTPVTASDRDLAAVLPAGSGSLANPLKDSGLEADDWRDMGPWVLLVVLVLAPLAFRRGFIAVVALAGFLGAVQAPVPARAQTADPTEAPQAAAPAPASFWQDLWKRPDQQGADAFGKGDYATAAARFQNPAWAASAAYKAGAYDKALGGFSAGRDADYNTGNALARAGRLEDAVAAYDKAIARDGTDEDARFNRELVQRLIDQQKQQDQQNQNDKQDQKDNKKNDQGGSGGGGDDQNKQDGDKDQKDPNQKDKGNSGKDQSDQNKDQDQKDKSGQSDNQDKPQDSQNGSDKQDNGKPDQKDQQGQNQPPEDQKQGDQQDKGAQDQKNGGKDQPDQAGKPDQGDQQPADEKPGEDQPGKDQSATDQQAQPPQPPGDKPQEAGQGNAGQQEAGQEEGGGARPLGQQNAAPPQPPSDPQQNALASGPRNNAAAGQQQEGGNVATMTEEDQNREQMLRMIPDDPTGLLRARIRAHYSQLGVAQ